MKFSFKNLFSNMMKPETPLDPSVFNDPLALKTSWNPLQGGGANFTTHKAVQSQANRIEFKPTVFSYLMLLIPVSFTVIFPLFLIRRSVMENGALIVDRDTFWGIFIGILCFVISYYLYRYLNKKIAFDKNYGYFWKGRTVEAGMPFDPSNLKEAVKLNDIHALQIIHEWISGSGKGNRPFKSYELNLVLNSGERVGVIDHGNIKRLLEDANLLSQFLGVPLWNTAEPRPHLPD